MNSRSYKIVAGIVDIIKMISIMVFLESESVKDANTYNLFNFIILNFYTLESIIRLSANNFKFSSTNLLEYFTIMSCMVAAGCYFVT